MTQEKKVQTAAVMDVTGVERAAQDAVRAATRMAEGIAKEGEKAGKGIEAMGAGAEKAERSVDAATKSISDRLRRLTRDSQRELSALAASSAGGAGSAASVEYEALLRGANVAKLQPQIDALRDLQTQAKSLGDAMRQAAAGDELIQSINARIAALQRQSQGAKMAEADLLALKAAELGVAQQADPLIAKMRESAAAAEAAAAAARNKADADRFLSGITAQAGAIGKTRADLLELQAAQLGVAEKAAPMIRAIREADGQMMGMGKSAKEMQWAMRGLPAQFTDIWVSLASGQSPMTVFIQQGGQLKDMFGGIGPAARAMGGFIAGLVNPFTVAAAAAGVLFMAYKSGSDEITKLSQAVVLSGERLGVTAGQMQQIAASVADLGNNTQGKASEFLGLIAKDAKVSAGELQRFTEAALTMERVGGPAAAETAKAFAELGKDPLQASIKLTAQFNYLTKATFEQIQALESQGRSTEAAALAQRAYAEFLEQRAPRMEAALGTIERAWKAVTAATAEAWDRLKSVGRDTALEKQYADLSASIMDIEAGKLGERAKADIPALREQANELRKQLELQQAGAIAAEQRAKTNEALARLSKFDAETADKQAKQRKEEAEFQRDAIAAGKSRQYIEEGIAKIRAKYAEKPAGAGRAADPFAADREAAKEWAEAYKRFSDLAADAAGKVGGLTKAQIELVKYLESPAYQNMAEPARQLVLQQAYAAINAEQAAAANKEWAASVNEAEREYNKLINAMENSAESAEKQLASLEIENRARALSVASGIDLKEAIDQITIARLEERRVVLAAAGNDAAVEMIDREIEARKKLALELRRAASYDAEKKRAEELVKEYEKLSDTITDALMRGFENGKDFARNFRDTVVSMFKTMVLRPIVQAIVNPVAMALTGGMGMSGGASAATNIVGQAGGYGNVAQSLSNLYSTISGSFTAVGTNVAMAADKIGEWLVMNTTGTLNQAGGTLMQYAGQIGAGSEIVAGAAAGMGLRRAIGKGYEISSGFSTFQDIGVAVASAIGGPVMGAIAGAVAGVVNRAFGRGPKTAYESGIEGSFSGGDATGDAYSNWIKKGGWFRSDKTGTDRTAMDKDIAQALDAGAAAVLAQTSAWAEALQLPADRLGELTSTFKVKFTDDAEANKQAIADIIKGYGDTLAAAYGDLLKPLQKTGETLSETLGRVSVLQTFSENLNQLGGVFSRVANLGIDVRESFISMAGGMDALMANAMGFAQNYYSREEIAGLKAGEIQRALLDAGVSGASDLTGRESFRALVEATDVSTELGRQQLAALLSVQSAFVDVADYLAETGSTLAQAATQAPDGGPLTSLISPLQQQTDATLSLTSGMGALRAAIDRMIDTLKQNTIGSGSAASQDPAPAFAAWPGEVYIDPNGGA